MVSMHISNTHSFQKFIYINIHNTHIFPKLYQTYFQEIYKHKKKINKLKVTSIKGGIDQTWFRNLKELHFKPRSTPCLNHTLGYGYGFRTLTLHVPMYGNINSTEYGQNPKYLVRAVFIFFPVKI